MDYFSLATVEFLVDKDGHPYLIEANTRLQVEHGITECRYGIDLVEEQMNVAFDGELRFTPYNMKPLHHAMQVRINFEDPQDSFSPNSGLITRYISHGGPECAWIPASAQATSSPRSTIPQARCSSLRLRLGEDLEHHGPRPGEYIIGGVKTTLPFHSQVIVQHPAFRAGECDTKFIDKTPSLMLYHDSESKACVFPAGGRDFRPGLQPLRPARRVSHAGDAAAPSSPILPEIQNSKGAVYPRGDRKAILDMLRDSDFVHFTDTTARDITQSNSGNRFRLAEDELMGPYLDNCGFFSLENGGGAHFHVAMLANMTYPFSEAEKWNKFAPRRASRSSSAPPMCWATNPSPGT